MHRYYSHYTFIYPDIYVKNYIVEMDNNGKIIRIFPYDREVEKTEFYSGLLAFIPEGESPEWELFVLRKESWNSLVSDQSFTESYRVWHKDSLIWS
jgi:hypothetical protein